MGYLDRLVERASGKPPAHVLARAARPDVATTDDLVETEAQRVAVAPVVADPERARVIERHIIERAPESPPIAMTIVQGAMTVASAPVPPASVERVETMQSIAIAEPVPSPATHVERIERRVEAERVETVHEHSRVEHERALRERVSEHTIERPLVEHHTTERVETTHVTQLVPAARPQAPVLPPLQPVEPHVELPAREPAPSRVVIGRVTVEIVPPPQAAPAMQRTVVVREVTPPQRTDVLRRGFGLGQE
jgi:hypothetical protein